MAMWRSVRAVGLVALDNSSSGFSGGICYRCRPSIERRQRTRSLFQLSDKNKSGDPKKPWRHASSLLIVAPMNEAPPYSLGYLMLERSKGSSVNPSGTVFPGGAVSPVDFAGDKWIPVFEQHGGVDLRSLKFLSSTANIPPIYKDLSEIKDNEEGGGSRLSPEVALRLTAIRETFEETGVLLARRGSPEGEVGMGEVVEWGDRSDVKGWQKKILKDPEHFVRLFEELKCVPDLWGLSEWNNWLTPTIYKAKARFDVMFFMTVLKKMPRVVYDTHEVAGAQWAQPSTLVNHHVNGEIKLMPPQLYEMMRLQNLPSIPQLQKAMETRRTLGVERHFPVIRAAQDGTIFLLPGDDLYPKTPDVDIYAKPTDHQFPSTLEELNSSSKNFHRQWIPFKKGSKGDWKHNVLRHGHSY